MELKLVHHCIKSTYARDSYDYYFTPPDKSFKSTGLEHSVILKCLRDEEEKKKEIFNFNDFDCIDMYNLLSFHSACEHMRTWINR